MQVTTGRCSGSERDRIFEFLERDAFGAKAAWLGFDAHLFHTATDGQHFGDSGNALQSARDRAIGKRAQVHRGDLRGFVAQSDQEDFSHQRGHRRHPRAGGFGKFHRLQTLLDQLAGLVNVGAPAEFDKYERESDIGIRAQAVESANAEQGIFQGSGDEGFDLLGSESRGLGENGDGGFRHVGQDLDGKHAPCAGAEQQKHERGGDDQRAVLE